MNIIRILFLLTFLAIFFCMHYYIYRRIKKDFSIPEKFNKLLAIVLSVIASLFFVSEILKRTTSFDTLAFFGEIWFGIICITMTILIIKDTVVFIMYLILKKILTKYIKKINYVTYILSLILIAAALLNGGRTPVIKNITIESDKIPNNFSGFKIVQLSDMHVNNTTSIKKLETIINIVNKLNPDVIAITGDMIDSKFFELQKERDIIKKFSSKYGVYTVSGNHEFYTGIDYFIEFNRSLGFKLLENESIVINNVIQLAGVHDLSSTQINPAYSSDMNKALKDLDSSKFTILLSHNPSKFDEAVKNKVDLQLSGHVHKGQFPPAYPAVYFMFKYPYGLYKVKKSYIYTTSGTLTWGPTMRLFSRNEIPVITLKSAKK